MLTPNGELRLIIWSLAQYSESQTHKGPKTEFHHFAWKSLIPYRQTYLLYVQMLFEEPPKFPLEANIQ